MHATFSLLEVPQFGSLRHTSPLTMILWINIKLATTGRKKTMASGYTTRTLRKSMSIFSTILGSEAPSSQKPFQTKRATTSAIAARVYSQASHWIAHHRQVQHFFACPSKNQLLLLWGDEWRCSSEKGFLRNNEVPTRATKIIEVAHFPLQWFLSVGAALTQNRTK